MLVNPIGESTTFEQVNVGACFVFRRGAKSYVAIKIINGPDGPRMAVLWPHHPSDAAIRTGILDGSTLARATVFLLPNAVAAPKFAVGAVISPAEAAAKIGTLAISGKSLFVTVSYTGAEAAWVDLMSGEIVFDAPRSAMWLNEWQIQEPDIDGVHKIICKISVAGAASQG
jgi:hypothetical protein